MNKIELLAPSGNLEKAKVALLYGADAVYVGGRSFSLRARASNFDLPDLKELCEFAHSLHKKVYVTMNIIPHDNDFNGLEEYLKYLNSIKVDAIITSSITIIKKAQEVAKDIEVHVSTQMSAFNSNVLKFWKRMGATRVVLARECFLSEITDIMKDTDIETEVFIHGGMCASFSGRCVLSNHYTLRDANRGGCAHSCRWNYHLYKGNTKINKEGTFFNMGSKDLMGVDYIPKLIDLNVSSLKIEGRMKSAYYLACVISGYRHLIDAYYEKGSLTDEDIKFFKEEIKRGENREASIGFLNGLPTINEQLYETLDDSPSQEYVASVISYNKETNVTIIEQRNYFKVGDMVEVISPIGTSKKFIIDKMIYADTKEDAFEANHPLERFECILPVEINPFDMIRKVKNN